MQKVQQEYTEGSVWKLYSLTYAASRSLDWETCCTIAVQYRNQYLSWGRHGDKVENTTRTWNPNSFIRKACLANLLQIADVLCGLCVSIRVST